MIYNNVSAYEKTMEEIEKRKKENTEILKSYGLI